MNFFFNIVNKIWMIDQNKVKIKLENIISWRCYSNFLWPNLSSPRAQKKSFTKRLHHNILFLWKAFQAQKTRSSLQLKNKLINILSEFQKSFQMPQHQNSWPQVTRGRCQNSFPMENNLFQLNLLLKVFSY